MSETRRPSSSAGWIRSLPPQELAEVRRAISEATEEEAQAFLAKWEIWARPEQLPPPGEWFCWCVKAGRGWGKTSSGANFVRTEVEAGRATRIALVNDTAADVRDVMVEGKSGILAVSHPQFRPLYEPSKRRVTWPNGAVAICYAAESPEMLRGPEHDLAWADEPAKWKNLRKRDTEGGTAWDNLLFGLRQGDRPRVCATTTPRAIKWIKDLLERPSTVVTGGSTYDNFENLSPVWFREVIKPYEGTRLGRQEIEAEIMQDVEGALWTIRQIDELRVQKVPVSLVRVAVALDPSVTSTEESDECGIVGAGLGSDGQGYVLSDDSLRASPAAWGARAIKSMKTIEGDRLIGEANNGGDLIETVLRAIDEDVPYKKVTASRGKRTRAEPIAALYEQKKVHHVGTFPALEDEMATWVPGEKSPNRMDALVWVLTELMLGKGGRVGFGFVGSGKEEEKADERILR